MAMTAKVLANCTTQRNTVMGKRLKEAIVVGIGSPMLKDNRLGIEVVEALNLHHPEVETAILYDNGNDVLDIIIGYEKAIIVDACQVGMRPGTILEIPREKLFDHENLGGAQAAELGSTLKNGQSLFPELMPKDLKLYLVEVEDISTFSTKCTPVVCHAINDVVERIQETTIGGCD
jgi:hydrogenase maturation protease